LVETSELLLADEHTTLDGPKN